MTEDERHFLLRELHSLTGVFPLGVFLFEHFYTNAKAMFGPEAFNEAAESLHKIPYLVGPGEILILAIPILFHGLYGLVISSTGSVNLQYYPRLHNFFYFLQRVSGILLLFFIAYHVWNTRLQTLFHGTVIDYQYMAEYFTPTAVKVIYIVGVLSAVYHLSNGLWSFAIKWGLTTTPRGQRNMFYACMGLFVVMSIVGIQIIYSFRLAG